MTDMSDQDATAARGHLTEARTSIDQATALLPPAVDVTPVIADAAAFDRALAAAAPFAVLTLASTFVYPAPLVLRQPITLVSETFADRRGTRMTVDEPAPRFLGGVDLPGDDIYCLGVEARQTDARGTIMPVRGARLLIDRARILGDPTLGGRRGINYAGESGAILRSYIDDIFTVDSDSQAIYSQDMGPGGLVIDDCYLGAAGQSIMFGGGDPTSEARIPRGIRITRSTLTKKPAWVEIVSGSFATLNAHHRYQCKTPFELKNAIDVEMRDCVLEYAGISQGQPSALIVLTPRNQNNTAPYTTVRDVRISNCVGRFAGGGVSMLGDDDQHPSGPLKDVSILNCKFEELNPAKWGGAGRVFFLNRGGVNIHLEAITATGTGIKSIVYCDERKPPTGLVLRNFKMPTVVYPYKTVLGITLAKLQEYAPDAVLDLKASDVGATL